MSFTAALTDPVAETPAGLRLGHRFDVYRNNVAGALINALGVRFPRTRAMMGEADFAAGAVAYMRRALPASPVLIHYGADFPDFLAGGTVILDKPWLADLARLENAWWLAYHAAEAKALSPADFAAIAASDFDGLVIRFHPSFSVVRSAFPVAALWQGETDISPRGQHVLVVRPDADVEVRVIAADTAAFLCLLHAGEPLGRVVETVLADDPDFNLVIQLQALISLRLAIALNLNSENRA